MAQIVEQPGLGDIIGSHMGATLSRDLERASQMKLQLLLQRQQQMQAAKGFQAAGLPPELAFTSPQVQAAYVKSHFKKPGAEAFGSALTSLEGSEEVATPETGMKSVAQALGVSPQQKNIPTIEDVLGISKPGATMLPQEDVQSQQPEIRPQATQRTTSKWQVQPDIVTVPTPDKRKLHAALKQMTPEQRIQYEKLKSEKVKAIKSEQAQISKELKPYIDKIDAKGGDFADETDMVLEKMEKFVNSGKLTGPIMYNFRKKLEESGKTIGGGIGTAAGAVLGGILGGTAGSILPGAGTAAGVGLGTGIGATAGGGVGVALGEGLMPKFIGTPEDQEFIKLGTRWLQGLKDIFGSQMSAREMDAYMAGIPNLSMSDEGKKEVIHDLRLMNAAARHVKKVKDDILKETKHVTPRNLKDMINERTAKYMQKLRSQFLDSGLKNLDLAVV